MTKKTTRTGNEVMITVTKNDKGEMHAVNAAGVATVQVAEIQAAEDIRQKLCFNLLTGTADPAIAKAIASRKLSSLLPTMARADQNALRAIAEVDHIKLQAAWAHYVENAKRVRGVSLQGLRSAYNAFYGDAKAPKASAKEQFLKVWSELGYGYQNMEDLKGLYDLAVDFGWEPEAAE